MGLVRVDISSFEQKYEAGKNGCSVPAEMFRTGFIVQLKQQQSMVQVTLIQAHNKERKT